RRRQTHPPHAAAALSARIGLQRPGRHPFGRGGGDGAYRYAGPRQHYRRRRYAARTAFGKHCLGNEKCVLAGDWLYMQAFKVALEEKDLRVLELLIGLTQQMVEGELLQIQKLGKAVSEAEYY